MSDEQNVKPARLVLEDGSRYEGVSFGGNESVAGEVVFNTGMVGYPETLTDPSYRGQLLVFTYPLIGNYGVPSRQEEEGVASFLESQEIQASAMIVSEYSAVHHHWQAESSLSQWLIENKRPGIQGIDTRALTKKLREKGSMLGKIEFDDDNLAFEDPNQLNLVAEVSIREPRRYGSADKTVILIDCGGKNNILKCLLQRGVSVLRVPWDYDLSNETFDGLMISNGPGDPKMCRKTILQIRQTIDRKIPTFGICLGHQLLALAAGANTFKLKYGHRSQNQPVIQTGTNRCLVTSQNHGFAVDNQTLPVDWTAWFNNLNDGTNEGIRHVSGPFMSVQFHPEATPGPVDAGFLFDEFISMLS